MLPLSLLKTAQGHPMLVELKNGDTYNGHLVNCDTWMNVNLREVICTSKDGDRFWKMPECYIRGNTIKYIRVPNEILDMIAKQTVDVAVEAVAGSVIEVVIEVDAADVVMVLVAEVGVVMAVDVVAVLVAVVDVVVVRTS
ncbi:U6 snRNA-associated Sm-like protein LSm4 [Phytophthora palmivora]|uniref:U6 snRNA-associated Sm-like protein LSm4 n=1 Tax=Phytophthora palmivora TaxID=4796 RepID=A0A2P4X4V5_9STRA|nr:U6 snRNA-associated Sm-like protein LSm4 [Phytophthora palmivora]